MGSAIQLGQQLAVHHDSIQLSMRVVHLDGQHGTVVAAAGQASGVLLQAMFYEWTSQSASKQQSPLLIGSLYDTRYGVHQACSDTDITSLLF